MSIGILGTASGSYMFFGQQGYTGLVMHKPKPDKEILPVKMVSVKFPWRPKDQEQKWWKEGGFLRR